MFYEHFRQTLSDPRLGPYRTTRQGVADDDLEVVARYAWNMALSEALYPTLQAFEIALRNHVDVHLTQVSARGQRWFEDGKLLTQGALNEAREAQSWLVKTDEQKEKRLAHKQRRAVVQPSPPLPGRVVAALNFGFWTELFNDSYEPLWRQLLKQPSLFPQLAGKGRTRSALEAEFNKTRRLRNRVFHHEPIWEKRGQLRARHDAIIRDIGWICTVLQNTVMLMDRFDAEFANGIAFHRARLQADFTLRGYLPVAVPLPGPVAAGASLKTAGTG